MPSFLFIDVTNVIASLGFRGATTVALVAALVSGIEGAVVVGGLSALGAALTQYGMPAEQAIQYETALKAEKYVLIVHGTADELEKARLVLTEAPLPTPLIDTHSLV